jgi:hypothetical protein
MVADNWAVDNRDQLLKFKRFNPLILILIYDLEQLDNYWFKEAVVLCQTCKN